MDGDCSHQVKRRLLLGRKAMTNLNSVLKSRDVTLPTKVCLVKAMVFPVVMYGCKNWTIKSWVLKNCCFELWCWRRLLRIPWTVRSNQSIWKEISTEYSLEGLMLKLKLQYFGCLMWKTDSLEKTLMLAKTEGRRGERGNRGWDGWMASLIQWTWVWADSGRQWRTRSQYAAVHGVEHDLATKRQQKRGKKAWISGTTTSSWMGSPNVTCHIPQIIYNITAISMKIPTDSFS